uniref:Telomere length regulation protein TEL2 homolog n=1 Tax=Mucochytrium quahogii TaxID=96639 RepID=A0A7S2WTN0_9STRA
MGSSSSVESACDVNDVVSILKNTSKLWERFVWTPDALPGFNILTSRLFRVVVTRWESLLSEKEKAELLDVYFDILGAKVPADVILSCLHSALLESYKFAQRQTGDYVAQTGLRVVAIEVCRLISPLFEDASKLTSCFAGKTSRDEDIVQCIGSFPDIVLGSFPPGKLQHTKCFRRQYYADCVALSVLSEKILPEFRGMILSKLVRIGHGEIVAQRVLKSKNTDLSILLEHINPVCIERFVIALIKAEEILETFENRLEFFRVLFPPRTLREGGMLHVLACKKLVLKKYMNPRSVWGFVDNLFESDRELFVETATYIASVWGDTRFVKGTDYERHLYVTGIVYNMIEKLDKAQIEKSGLMILFVKGVQKYLESAVVQTRKLGMIVGELFASRINPNSPLTFEELARDDEKFPYARSTAMSTKPVEDAVEKIDLSLADEISPVQDDDDPEQLVDFNASSDEDGSGDESLANRKKAWCAWSDDSDDESSGDESVESLEPLGNVAEVTNDIEKVDTPTYLSDCIKSLQSDNYNQVVAVLTDLGSLIVKQPRDLELCATDAAKSLLYLENRFAIESFSSLKDNALVALVCTCPELVVPELASVVLQKKATFMSVRLCVLEVFVRAAKELSQVKPSSVEEEQATESATVGTVTKRWGVPKKPPPEPQISRFASIAPRFFFPLIPANDDIAFLDKEPILFSRLLFATSSILGLSKNSIHVNKMGLALFKLLYYCRNHSDAQVRRAALFGFAHLLNTVPTSLLFGDVDWSSNIVKARSWVEQAQTQDPDPACRTEATLLAKLLLRR